MSPPSIDDDTLRRQVKAELRSRMRSIRKTIPPEARQARAARIWERVLARPEWASASTVALFVSMRTEVDTTAALEAARAAGKRVVAPRMTEQGLELREWQVGVEPVEHGRMRVPEPPETAPLVDPSEVDLVIVPALAYDPRGARIGYGAGYYDELLPRATKALRVGVVFDFQLLAEVPETAGDQRVHLVATDERLLDAR